MLPLPESFDQLPWDVLGISGLVFLIFTAILFGLVRRSKHLQKQAALKAAAEASAGISKQSPATPSEAPATPIARAPSDVNDILQDNQQSWLGRLRAGLSKTRQQLSDNLSRLLSGGQLIDDKTLEQVHEVLYRSDMGVETADQLVAALKQRFGGSKEAPTWPMIAAALQESIETSMGAPEPPLNQPAEGPLVILVVGVNGVGKTTSIGKLAARFLAQGKSVLLAAGDTYRAAAIEQLQVWGDRLSVPVIRHQQGSDPASVAFDAVKAAKARAVDVLLIDTAGRLHNKQELMDELAKIKKVIGRELPSAPHETWLVIDATTGQNAIVQVKAFGELIQLSGLIVTKLDGTAKGGVIIGIRQRFQLPIRYIGVGEKAADLKEFSIHEFTSSLFA